jgi:ABC-2 type transport system permease protein
MNPHHENYDGPLARFRRIRALVLKESRQVIRDPSSLAIGVVLPLVLILLFGYGLSLDVKNVPVAVVLENPTPDATELAAGFTLSPYFNTRLVTSMPLGQELLLSQQVDGIVRIRPDLSRQMSLGGAPVQILVDGTDANKARIIQTYAQGAMARWFAVHDARGAGHTNGPVMMQDQMWFNQASDSHYFLVPGLVVLVMTLIGAFLTAMVMSREWERGTFEALFVTPVRVEEILLGKMIPYFVLGMMGLALCLLSAKFLFHIPFRGSITMLTVTSMLYLIVSLAIGLLISSIAKSQFVASQLALLVTFLPAVMLSGFMFDLRSMPALVRGISYVLPARYYVALLQTIFLAGDVWSVVVPNATMLMAMAVVLLVLTRAATQKKLA